MLPVITIIPLDKPIPIAPLKLEQLLGFLATIHRVEQPGPLYDRDMLCHARRIAYPAGYLFQRMGIVLLCIR